MSNRRGKQKGEIVFVVFLVLYCFTVGLLVGTEYPVDLKKKAEQQTEQTAEGE
jgi:hypothetical protein